MMLVLRVACLIALAASTIPVSTSFLASPYSPNSWRVRATRLRVEPEVAAPTTKRDEPCPGFPRCTGEYRGKGCDGEGRIAGGMGALLPWLPVKAYRPCPAFVEAKYKYSRQGQSLDEVVFARREVSIPGDPYETDVDANDPDERDDEGIGNGSKK
ncbi:unnamed protein product [Ascophyllum nodosum]